MRLFTLGFTTLTVLLFGVKSAGAGLVVYTSRAAWRAAAGGGVGDLTEDFNTYSGTTYYATNSGATAGFLHFATVSLVDQFDPSWSINDDQISRLTAVDGSPFVTMAGFTIVSSENGDTLITHSPVKALGFDYRASGLESNEASPLSLTTSWGDTIDGPTINVGTTGFVGIVYDAGESFSTTQVHDLTDGFTFFTADNFEAFSVAEPSSIACVGIVAVGLLVRTWLLGTPHD